HGNNLTKADIVNIVTEAQATTTTSTTTTTPTSTSTTAIVAPTTNSISLSSLNSVNGNSIGCIVELESVFEIMFDRKIPEALLNSIKPPSKFSNIFLST
ncbi:hypothetical protein DDB_G0291846, partial [Dictyostelium discoideum AX4]